MDPDFLLAVLAWVMIVAFVCGTILLFPISRKLAELLQLLIEAKRKGTALESRDLQSLRANVSAHEAQIARLVEKQEFLERLLGEEGASETPGSIQPVPTGGRTREEPHRETE